jgi:single-stranded DNA-binding protein
MNFASLTVTLVGDPIADSKNPNWFVSRCLANVSPAGKNRVDTPLELVVVGDRARLFQENAKAGMKVFVNRGTLRHDLESRKFSVISGSVEPVNDGFTRFNDVVLAGRCIKDIDESDPKIVRRTADGLLIVNQTLQVRTGDGQSDLFNLVAMNGANDKLPLARMMADFTRKGSGLTVWGRLSTRSWVDQSTGEPRISTQLAVSKMTLPPRPRTGDNLEIKPQASISEGSPAKSLWPGNSENGWASQPAQLQQVGSAEANEPF